MACLCCHEICNGTGYRKKALDKPYAILVVCQRCHEVVQEWSETKQLALMFMTTPDEYDLSKYLELTKPNDRPNRKGRITQSEVLEQVAVLSKELDDED